MRAALRKPPAMALTITLLHPKSHVARLTPSPQPLSLLLSSNSECLSVLGVSTFIASNHSFIQGACNFMPSTGGSAGNRHAGPHPHSREDKGRQGCAGKNKPGEGGGV